MNKIYYVSERGSGKADGTSAQDSWSAALFNASTAPGSGDRVKFNGVFSSAITPNSGGNESAPLILDFAGATLERYIGLDSKAYLSILGGTFAPSAQGGPSGALLDFTGGLSHDISIEGWTYIGPEQGIVDFVSLARGKCYQLSVSGNRLDNIKCFLIAYNTSCHHITILNNDARTSTNEVAQTDLVFISDTDHVMIRGNRLINRAPGDYYAAGRHNDVIQSYRSGSTPNKNPTGWVICYNWIEQADSAGDGSNSWTMLENMTGPEALKIFGNVFVGSGTRGTNGMTTNSNLADTVCYCYNNTYIRLSTSASGPIRFQNQGSLYFRNNTMQWAQNDNSQSFESAFLAAAPWDYNWFFGTSPPSQNVTATHGSMSQDPLFSDFHGGDYSTREGSPLRGSGDDSLGEMFSQGIAPGATWPGPKLIARPAGNWDVGAFQHEEETSGTPPVIPPAGEGPSYSGWLNMLAGWISHNPPTEDI